MSLKKRNVPSAGIKKIISILNLFLNYYSSGLLCFFGDEPFPDTQKLAEIISAEHKTNSLNIGRVDGGSRVPFANLQIEASEGIKRTISEYGGIESFIRAFTLYEAEIPQRAKILRDLSSVGSVRYPNVETVAMWNHMSVRHLYRLKEAALYQIAAEINRRGRIIY